MLKSRNTFLEPKRTQTHDLQNQRKHLSHQHVKLNLKMPKWLVIRLSRSFEPFIKQVSRVDLFIARTIKARLDTKSGLGRVSKLVKIITTNLGVPMNPMTKEILGGEKWEVWNEKLRFS